MTEKERKWMTSAEVRKILKVSTCDLAHLREEGRIRAEKRGNAYYYAASDVDALRKSGTRTRAGFCMLDGDE